MAEKKKGIRKDVRNKTNEGFEGGLKQMWVGIQGIPGKQAREADSEITTLRAQNGKMGINSSSKGKREVLVLQQSITVRKERPQPNETSDAENEKKINAWAEANVDASEREDSGSEGLQRDFTREEANMCVAEPKNGKAAEADKIRDSLLKYGAEGMLAMSVVLCDWIWKTGTHLGDGEKE